MLFFSVKASQMWTLARLLPLMIGEYIPSNDPYWENFLLLLTITDYVFAPITSVEIADYVATVIDEHYQKFRQLYPNSPIIPKMHYNIHLSEWMKLYVRLN